jgi:hypothetical protein
VDRKAVRSAVERERGLAREVLPFRQAGARDVRRVADDEIDGPVERRIREGCEEVALEHGLLALSQVGG